MAPFPEEVDVFSAPHWRMKQLVQLYCDKLSTTNFSNDNDFQTLLRSLCATFREFKTHEQIENECIMAQLKYRLERCAVTNNLVYKVHSDNKLTEMLTLFEKGLRNAKNEYERVNYGMQLKEQLEEFTRDFIPHMKEEEEVFQPLLMEYFTYEELKVIKSTVIAQHCSNGSQFAQLLNELRQARGREKLELDSKEEEKSKSASVSSSPIGLLPPEVLLQVFGYLGVQDLCRCSQVCTDWALVCKDGSLWKHLYPTRWANEDWYTGPPEAVDEQVSDEDESCDSGWGGETTMPYTFRDEDADIDESAMRGNQRIRRKTVQNRGRTYKLHTKRRPSRESNPGISYWSDCDKDDDLEQNQLQRELGCLKTLVQSILPVAGPSVKSLVLSKSKAANNSLVQRILSLCPNLEYLDLTQTKISDSAFKSLTAGAKLKHLKHLDLSGCDMITDVALHRISMAMGTLSPSKPLGSDPGPRKVMVELEEVNNSCPLPPNNDGEKDINCTSFTSQSSTLPLWALTAVNLLDIEEMAMGMKGMPLGCVQLCTLCDQRTEQCPLRPAGQSSGHCGHVTCKASKICRSATVVQSLADLVLKATSGETKDIFTSDAETSGRVLAFLSLSGCRRVTDEGLRSLAMRGGLPLLEHLDLSGCRHLTGAGLQDLVSMCPMLNDEHFFYCDFITGPRAETANGCQNLQCSTRSCCRSGE
ncbi:F-box/LRR-repeat protein 5 isoform X2 [Lampetra fluviatilis]